MNQILAAFLAILVFQSSAHAADEIRIGVPELNAQFVPLALETVSQFVDFSVVKKMRRS
jgi:hypothetical protein